MSDAKFELYYWPGIPGRGEFVRLVLEEAGADWVDVGLQSGGKAVTDMIGKGPVPAYAPPVLKVGDVVISQAPNICSYLGERFGLVPQDEASRLHARQFQLTVADVVAEAHDTHHPLAVMKYYDEQKDAAKQRAEDFRTTRIPKFLGYFERVLKANTQGGGKYLLGRDFSYPELALYQLVEGLLYAFPNAMRRVAPGIPGVMALRQRISERPRIAAYKQSNRAQPFNQQGIFRHYPELDDPNATK
ncbi:glutathione S-transferase [Corallococcus sp. AB049A]|uniref:Glutathione S-transferase n=1 Tax=Corallococcus interemptor TaxID=2316720 RepID=A0A3A8QT04_9BACT|nr:MULTISPECIES: glutathione S-transferase [Corallococcus]RKH71836.1 glutathione S-transferase [Corallococcus interemptor]RKI47377.1 glutathione S-transferase [Corallococcus sp. AB049A]